MRQTEQNVSPMSNEGRNAYVIKHINEALLGLLKEKSLNEISISEICETAGVGRMSFYRNYESKEDVIKTFTGKIKEGNRKRDDGLPDVFIKIHAKKPFNIQLYDNIQVFMTEKDYQKARYGE